MKKRIIALFYGCFFCSMAVAQITSDRIYSVSYKYSDDDVIISDIQYFDTLYHISNVNVSDEYIRTHCFDNSAEFYFWSDSLVLPPMSISKEKFAQYILKPHSFCLEGGYTFIKRVVLPAIHDSTLYHRIEQYYVETDAVSRTHIINTVDNGHYRYYSFYYKNTNCFLTVYIRARRFNYEINRIYSPPRYLFPSEAEESDCYIRFLVPLVPTSE